ncbi:MAG: hypothetical protein U9O98_07600 [Asgard group archaeon]|nr:hypothetical protein [Asgard group archaeon]
MSFISLPVTSEQLSHKLSEIVSQLVNETGWELKRDPTEVGITIGEAPKNGESFGVERSADSLCFALWISDLDQKFIQKNLWDFLLTREAFSFFLEWDYFSDDLHFLTNIIINFLAFSFFRETYSSRNFRNSLALAQSRFLHHQTEQYDQELLNLLNDIIDRIYLQETNYKLILSTYQTLISTLPYDNHLTFLQTFQKYLLREPQTIVAPLYLRPEIFEVVDYLITKKGFGQSLEQIGKAFNIDQTTVFRYLTQINANFQAKWYAEENLERMGLRFYILLVKFSKNETERLKRLQKILLQNPYISDFYSGKDESFLYLFCFMKSTTFNAEEILYRNLEKYQNQGFFLEFELIDIKQKSYRLAFITRLFQPNLKNYMKLLTGELSCEKRVTFDSKTFSTTTPKRFSEKERDLLHFLSFFKSNAITATSLYYTNFPIFEDFLEKHDLKTSNRQKYLTLLNNLRTQAISEDLIRLKLRITRSPLGFHDILVIRIPCDPTSEETQILINDLSIFNYQIIHRSPREIFFSIIGIPLNHPFRKLLEEFIRKRGFTSTILSIKNLVNRRIRYEKLYSFDVKRWKLM